MSDNLLDLRFGPGSPSGFTPSGIAGFSDLRSAAVVRELIQNSLDAAVEANVGTARVTFRITEGRTREIPGIEAYEGAFSRAKKTHEQMAGGRLRGPAARVVKVIEDAVGGETHCILSVLDNGIGLDSARMTALLSDGVSAKGEAATGTFGNGHSVAIPASNLRYVLYGGITADGSRIGSGHAVIASSVVPDQPHQASGDGFLVKAFHGGSYEYAEGSDVPDLIARNLDDIQGDSGHGTAVIISAFNYFRQNKGRHSLWSTVSKAAASNFFQAIQESRLVVTVEDRSQETPRDPISLDASNLRDVLENNRNQKRVRGFLSGQKAFAAHEVLRLGKTRVVKTDLGDIRVQILPRSSGTARIDLCRNGMWIADDKRIPGFYYKFADRRPFHALFKLDADSGGRFHELVRNAEGPLHDKLDVRQRLSQSEARQLRKAFAELRAWLRSKVPKVSSQSYSPDDFLSLDFGHDGTAGKARRSFWGTPVPVTRRNPALPHAVSGRLKQAPPDPPRPGSGPRPKPQGRPVLRPFFQVASIPLGPNQRWIHLECQKACRNAELRLCIDENVDATCDPLRRHEIETVYFTRVDVGDRAAVDGELVREEGRIVGVRLGDIAANTSLDVRVRYKLPRGLLVLPKQEPALRVEVFQSTVSAYKVE